jgi:ribosomal protein S18 acetylase RimI-like enzyme
MMITFRAVRANDWPLVKEAYINMFNDSPDAYGEPAQQILQRNDEAWKRFTNAHTRMTTECAYLALRGNRLCGFVRCTALNPQSPPGTALNPQSPHGTALNPQSPPGTALISNLWVHPDHRRKGNGSRLINLAITWVRWKGIFFVTLGVMTDNGQAAGYYESLGFKDMGSRLVNPYNPTQTIIIMGKKIYFNVSRSVSKKFSVMVNPPWKPI